MIILGAGLTGCIAAHVFKEAQLIEPLAKPSLHKAVLRFRSDAIAQITGIPFRKVEVRKGLISQGVWAEPNIRLLNQYSQKVAGGTYERSVGNLSTDVRWVAPIDFHQRMLDNLGPRVVLGSFPDIEELQRPVVSTLPLPVLIKQFNLDSGFLNVHSARPIYVTTVTLHDCDVFQTAYDCDLGSDVYRASITGNQLIIESVQPITKMNVNYVCDWFGVECYDDYVMNTEQKFGKFIPLEDEFRKDYMYMLTNQYGIYSLGRHATWRKIVLDDVVNDINRIESMLRTSAYDRMLGKTK